MVETIIKIANILLAAGGLLALLLLVVVWWDELRYRKQNNQKH